MFDTTHNSSAAGRGLPAQSTFLYAYIPTRSCVEDFLLSESQAQSLKAQKPLSFALVGKDLFPAWLPFGWKTIKIFGWILDTLGVVEKGRVNVRLNCNDPHLVSWRRFVASYDRAVQIQTHRMCRGLSLINAPLTALWLASCSSFFVTGASAAFPPPSNPPPSNEAHLTNIFPNLRSITYPGPTMNRLLWICSNSHTSSPAPQSSTSISESTTPISSDWASRLILT